ncbi:hypothetical protein NJ56_08760 [Yersinia ruckeri]|nr:hypothetical protein NJ56_08760 [Yersinia ruckeri]
MQGNCHKSKTIWSGEYWLYCPMLPIQPPGLESPPSAQFTINLRSLLPISQYCSDSRSISL